MLNPKLSRGIFLSLSRVKIAPIMYAAHVMTVLRWKKAFISSYFFKVSPE